MGHIGKVWLAGAGPGDAGLLTVKTEQLIENADVIVYDALISAEILSLIPPDKEWIYVGKRSGKHELSQEKINQILCEEALRGKNVLRLKGGDPFIFGRGGEELELLAEHKIPFEIVPGISSAAAVPAYAGIPVTHRDYTSSFHVITGHPRKDGNSQVDYQALARLDATLVFLMGITAMEAICKGLMDAGMDGTTPAAVLEKGTTAAQRRVVSTVEHLKEESDKAEIKTPALIVIGKVCTLSEGFHWAEDRPLGGRQFLITRPRESGSLLAERLRSLGAQVIELPAIVTKEKEDNQQLFDALDRMEHEKVQGWLVFTSPIGVKIFFRQLLKRKMDLRRLFHKSCEIKIAAIGSATEQALQEHGLFPDLVPETYCAKNLGEKLAFMADPQSYILIVRAAQGSRELIPPLLDAGLTVEDVSLYETLYQMHPQIRGKIRSMLAGGEIDAITFTSGSTVRGFVESVGPFGESELELAAGLTAVCIGEQTAAKAAELKIPVLVSREASIDSMVELVLEHYKN